MRFTWVTRCDTWVWGGGGWINVISFPRLTKPSYPPFSHTQAPKCLEKDTLSEVVAVALTSPMEEVAMHAKLLDGYTRKVRQLGGLPDEGKSIIEDVRAVSRLHHNKIR